MDRRGFLKRFGALVGVATVAPTVVHTVVKEAVTPDPVATLTPEQLKAARLALDTAMDPYAYIVHPNTLADLRNAQIGTLGGFRLIESNGLMTMPRGTCKTQAQTMAMLGHRTDRRLWDYGSRPHTLERYEPFYSWHPRNSRDSRELREFAEARRAVAGVRAEEALKAVAEDYLTGQTHFWRI